MSATYKFGPEQNLPRNIGSNKVVPDEADWHIIVQQENSVKSDLDFTI